MTVEATGPTGQAVTIGTATATDDVDPAPAIDNDAPTTFGLGTTVVTWTATDASGNSASTTQNVIVQDTTAPSISAPANVTAEATSLSGQVVAIGNATASDIADPAPAITDDAPALFPLGTTVVTWTATDASGNSASTTQNVTVQDTTDPIPAHSGPFSVDEGSSILLDGTGLTDNLAVQSTAWDIDGDGFDDGDPATFNGIDGPATQNVSLQITDHAGNVSVANTTVTVNNVAPTIVGLNAPIDPQAVSTSITVTVDFTDPGVQDGHTVTIAWDDGSPDSSVTVGPGIGTATLNHTFAGATVATLTVTVTDDDGGTASVTHEFIVIYDPSAGFVTGGGWINSPAAACLLTTACLDATGKANFGLVAKYKPGQQTPIGNTQFNFKAGKRYPQKVCKQSGGVPSL